MCRAIPLKPQRERVYMSLQEIARTAGIHRKTAKRALDMLGIKSVNGVKIGRPFVAVRAQVLPHMEMLKNLSAKRKAENNGSRSAENRKV